MVAVEMWDEDASRPISGIELRRFAVGLLAELARHVMGVEMKPWRLIGVYGVSHEELGYQISVPISVPTGGRYPRTAYFTAEDLAHLFRGTR